MKQITKIKTITDIDCSACPSITCSITSLYKERIEYLEKLVPGFGTARKDIQKLTIDVLEIGYQRLSKDKDM